MIEHLGETRRTVYIVDGARTPFLKALKPGAFSAADLAVAAGRELLLRQSFSASDLDEVIVGCTIPSPDEANIARNIALRLGCGDQVPAYTVQRNCASGMQALDNALQSIASGRHDLILAGGTEAMSHAPLLLNQEMTAWLGQWYRSKKLSQKAKLIAKLKPAYFKPIVALMRGLSDPLVELSMGQTAENLAYRFDITRLQMDEYAVTSHMRLAQAYQEKYLDEINPLYDNQGNYFATDDGLRSDSSVEKLSHLKPFFDKKFGMVTPGNSSQVTDGAALLILASEVAVKRYELPVLGKIVACNWAGLNPAEMGLGPVHASIPMLQQLGLNISDIDYWELNEAFAAQVLACFKAMADDEYCRQHFGGLAGAFGEIDLSRVNVDGGAISLGHPVGASGARIVLHLCHVLSRQNAQRGIATLCIGGGQGGAMLVERDM